MNGALTRLHCCWTGDSDYHLKKALYGLKTASRMWKFDSMGFLLDPA